MKFAFFFIDRPVFAAVLSIVTVIVGAISMFHAADLRSIPKSRRRR